MITPKLQYTEQGENNLIKFINKFKGSENAHVQIGIFEGAGTYTADGSGETVSVVKVAFWNEFGTKKSSKNKHPIPERSFIRSAIDDNKTLINHWREDLIGEMLKDRMDLDTALETMGYRIQNLIENKIKSDIAPENAPSTAKQKVRDGVAVHTLIHTGLLLRSITYKVNL